MKLILEELDGSRKTFYNVKLFQQFPEKDSPRILVYVTQVEKGTETTEKLEFWESLEIHVADE
jgi:hypothetical protein